MNIALIGFGKMGREVERAAGESGDTVVACFDSSSPASRRALVRAEICIDFSTPEAVIEHMELAAESGIDIVVGTTGWYQHLDQVRGLFGDSAMLYAHNFSVGMNIFFRAVKQMGALMNGAPEYDVYVQEHHNSDKVDSPSGTALRLGDILLEQVDRKKQTHTGSPAGGISPDSLQLSSLRAGTVPGSHTVGFDSPADSIELRHASKNRAGFAIGALKAARWVIGKKGVYTMDDVDL